MSPTIRNDPARPSGGHALLEGSGLAGVAAVTVENVSSGLFLSAGGRWAKLPHPFPVEPEGDALRLGPAVVDHVPEELLVALRSDDGRDLGRLFWEGVMPSRGRAVAAPPQPMPVAPPPVPPPPPPAEAAPPRPEVPAAAPGPAPAPVAAEPSPAREPATRSPGRRPARRAVPLAGAALVVLLAAGGAWALLRGPAPAPAPPVPSPQDRAQGCARDFGGKVQAARAGSDDDRVAAAEAALAGGCGAQAFAALDGADWEMSEAAAWHLARFYDPNETDPSMRAAATAHPDWAAAYYARWAPRVPREAAALKQLCTTDAAALDANAQLKRACGR